MPLPKDPHRFPEALELLNRAIESPKGIKVGYPTCLDAYKMRQKMYTKMGDSRRESKEMFEQEDPRWGKSPYDSLRLELEPGYTKETAHLPATLFIKHIDQEYFQLRGITIEDL